MLGGFDQIANSSAKHPGRADTFEIGSEWQLPPRSRRPDTTNGGGINTTFVQGGAQPKIASSVMSRGGFEASVQFPLNGDDATVRFRTPSREFVFFETQLRGKEMRRVYRRAATEQFDIGDYLFFAWNKSQPRRKGKKQRFPTDREVDTLLDPLLSFRRFQLDRPYAFAPVRTKPLRTYDPVGDVSHPEGGHVPMVLAQTYLEDESRWLELKSVLERFGKISGLFTRLDIRTLARKSAGSPFQIRVMSVRRQFPTIQGRAKKGGAFRRPRGFREDYSCGTKRCTTGTH